MYHRHNAAVLYNEGRFNGLAKGETMDKVMVEKEEVFDYLDALRESGITNMFSSPSYLMRQFDISKPEAFDLFIAWTEQFEG